MTIPADITINDFSTIPIEQWEAADIYPYPFNNKKHPPKHIEMLAKSIDSQGHLDPIAIDQDGVIISGHGRFEALKSLGRKRITVRVLRGITEEQARALRIAANKTVSNEYDTDVLQGELEKLNAAGFDVGTLGFEQKELDMLLSDVGLMDDDAITLDIDAAIDVHESDVDARAAAADGDDVRLDKAFGFKTVPLPDQKTVTRFMAIAEAETGKTGVKALIEHMRQHMAKPKPVIEAETPDEEVARLAEAL